MSEILLAITYVLRCLLNPLPLCTYVAIVNDVEETPMTQLTVAQKSALETLTLNKVSSASDFDRHAFEALVRKGIAIKHSNGRQTTYTLAPSQRLTA